MTDMDRETAKRVLERVAEKTLDKEIGKLIKKGDLEETETTAGFVVMAFIRREINNIGKEYGVYDI